MGLGGTARPGLLCFVLKSIASHKARAILAAVSNLLEDGRNEERFFAKKPEEQPFDVAEGEN